MSFGSTFRTAMHREPVVVWSLIIGSIGLAAPVVVPPVRAALGYGQPKPLNPPPIAELLKKE